MKKKLFVVPAVLGTIGTFLTPYVLFKRFIGRFIIKDEMNLGKEWMPYKTELTVKYDELKALPHESVKIESFDKLRIQRTCNKRFCHAIQILYGHGV